jgi:hypothetical protein
MTIARQRFGKHVPVAAKKHRKQNIRGTVRHVVLYSVPSEVIKEYFQFIGESEPSFGIRQRV